MVAEGELTTERVGGHMLYAGAVDLTWVGEEEAGGALDAQLAVPSFAAIQARPHSLTPAVVLEAVEECHGPVSEDEEAAAVAG